MSDALDVRPRMRQMDTAPGVAQFEIMAVTNMTGRAQTDDGPSDDDA